MIINSRAPTWGFRNALSRWQPPAEDIDVDDGDEGDDDNDARDIWDSCKCVFVLGMSDWGERTVSVGYARTRANPARNPRCPVLHGNYRAAYTVYQFSAQAYTIFGTHTHTVECDTSYVANILLFHVVSFSSAMCTRVLQRACVHVFCVLVPVSCITLSPSFGARTTARLICDSLCACASTGDRTQNRQHGLELYQVKRLKCFQILCIFSAGTERVARSKRSCIIESLPT